MNREILFRGKRIDNDKGMLVNNGDWVKGFYFYRSSQHYIKMPHIRNGVDVLTDYEVDPATVGQYTGLKDKNGVKIFEGDVVRSNLPDNEFTGAVEYGDMCVCKAAFYVNSDIGIRVIHSHNIAHIEIISNIHDTTPQGEG